MAGRFRRVSGDTVRDGSKGERLKKNILPTLTVVLLAMGWPVSAATSALALSHFHAPQYDGGKLISWHIDAAGPFDYIMDIEAKWWSRSPLVNGWPAYITAAELTRDYIQANGATLGATNAMGIVAYLRYFAYTGDTTYLDMARSMGDFIVQRDLTPADNAAYPRFPWPVGPTGSITPDGSGHPACHAGEVMPDKGAMLGAALVRLYEATGDTTYLNVAVHIADVLADRAVTGTPEMSPWPFRCKAGDGAMVDGLLSGNQSFALRLFDELIRLGIQGNGKYGATRANVWSFIKNVEIADTTGGKWQDYFEDHSGNQDNPNQYCALETARYLLERKEALDPDWSAMVGSIISTVKRLWVVHSGDYTSIGEQKFDMTPYNSHTARYGSILAMYSEAGGPAEYKDEAYGSLAYSTYSVDSDGFADTYYDRNIAWTSDSFGDWMNHFVEGLGAVPEWAPDNANHLLRSTSVVQAVSYGPTRVAYRTFDSSATDKLKLDFRPNVVTVDGHAITTYTWNDSSKVLVVNRSTGRQVEVTEATVAIAAPVGRAAGLHFPKAPLRAYRLDGSIGRRMGGHQVWMIRR